MTAPGPTAPGLTAQAAAFSAGLDLAAVPAAACAVARGCMQDFVGVALAGVPEAASRGVRDWVGAEGAAPRAAVFGTALRTGAAGAALANGTAGHALDLDDVCLALRGHPSTVVAPAALAVTEAYGRSGADALAGYIAGVELVIALGFGIGRTHYPAGWHSTATLGTLGAAAAAARVLRLDARRTAHALGIAASFAGGMRCNFGTMTKPLHAGQAARNGVTAAGLAAHGVSANPAALEAPLGFIALFSQDGDPARVAARLGRQWSLLDPGMCIKRHPCCYGTHHAIDAMLALRDTHRLDPAAVRRIEVRVAPGGLAALIHPRPHTGLQAKFSLPYALAAALTDGSPSLATFTDAAVARPALRALMERVHCREDPGPPVGADDPRYAELHVELHDGRVLSRRVEHPHGAPQDPLSPAELDRKFLDCAGVVLDAAAAARALHALHDLEHLADLRPLTAALAGPATGA